MGCCDTFHTYAFVIYGGYSLSTVVAKPVNLKEFLEPESELPYEEFAAAGSGGGYKVSRDDWINIWSRTGGKRTLEAFFSLS